MATQSQPSRASIREDRLLVSFRSESAALAAQQSMLALGLGTGPVLEQDGKFNFGLAVEAGSSAKAIFSGLGFEESARAAMMPLLDKAILHANVKAAGIEPMTGVAHVPEGKGFAPIPPHAVGSPVKSASIG